ncbi:spsA protein [Sporocytophaga myxococcoides]|uniref:SpsA protein n=1 Tax=Sporocytophaga myxococcoides TaxID=153721 RepID=A0A098LCS7_9BACT|nr:glycosyltransferase family 2 protein [Sporocytophaga myxococcoides]GAL84063.1 spsA protein [Sporocytophaga myxococcoides]
MNKITFIILTYNEEKNIGDLLDNLKGIPGEILVVDSYSKDKTIDIVKERSVCYLQHPFENYSVQRNWAQENNPFKTDWVFHLDADERLTTELRSWLINDFKPSPGIDGYMFGRRAIFMGKWIKSHYNYHLRLFKPEKGGCEAKAYDQHFIVNGKTQVIKKKDMTSEVADNLNNFIASHNKWSFLEAIDVIKNEEGGEVKASFWGSPIERKRWMKNNLFHKTPLFLRSFIYFFYRYFIQMGFLDGKEGLAFHVLQAFWFRFLIDAKVLEIKLKMKENNQDLDTTLETNFGFNK